MRKTKKHRKRHNRNHASTKVHGVEHVHDESSIAARNKVDLK